MKNNKDKILMIVGIITLLVFVGGATFAYFVAQGGSSEQTGVNVLTHTTDSLVFEVGKAISITADQTSFASGAGNRSDDTFARATLKANSSTNSATEHYYVYLNIDTNEFKYTTDTKTAELILTVNYKDNEGNITPVTSIKGLNYVTVGEVSGFDITEEKNLITIANNYEITSTGTEVDEWDITLTLVNLDSNQNANTGKTFNATLMIQKEELFAGHIMSLYTTQGENNLYYHNGTILANASSVTNDIKIGDIIDANDKSYRYAGGDYKVAPAYQETAKKISDVIGFVCDGSEATLSTTCETESYYYLKYETVENKTQYATYKDALSKSISDEYILSDLVKNFVCFGDDCTNDDNLYRIIGVFNGKVKLIKAYYAESNLLGENGEISEKYITSSYYNLHKSQKEFNAYYWNRINKDLAYNETNNYSIWSYSELNKTNLNTNFINNIGSKWSEMIDESIWYISGLTDTRAGRTSKTAYEYELGKYKSTEIEPYKAKIGLMYLTEYFYALSPDNWILTGIVKTRATDTNWLYLAGPEWTITRRLNSPSQIFRLYNNAYTVNGASPYNNYNAVRPTFYLKSTVTFAGGTGTETDPYRIA